MPRHSKMTSTSKRPRRRSRSRARRSRTPTKIRKAGATSRGNQVPSRSRTRSTSASSRASSRSAPRGRRQRTRSGSRSQSRSSSTSRSRGRRSRTRSPATSTSSSGAGSPMSGVSTPAANRAPAKVKGRKRAVGSTPGPVKRARSPVGQQMVLRSASKAHVKARAGSAEPKASPLRGVATKKGGRVKKRSGRAARSPRMKKSRRSGVRSRKHRRK